MSERPKKRLVRSSMADELLDRAWRQSDLDRRAQVLQFAMFLRYAGKFNENQRAHLGRPKGSTHKASDAPAHKFMDEISEDTGLTRRHTLARKAVEAGKVELRNTTKGPTIKRLAASWKPRRKVQK